VTLTATAGTASSADFDSEPITVSWPDGDTEPRVVAVAITDDNDDEQDESFTVALAQATGGAVIGPLSSLSVTISDNDASNSGAGGGQFGWLSVMLLGATGLRRWLRR